MEAIAIVGNRTRPACCVFATPAVDVEAVAVVDDRGRSDCCVCSTPVKDVEPLAIAVVGCRSLRSVFVTEEIYEKTSLLMLSARSAGE